MRLCCGSVAEEHLVAVVEKEVPDAERGSEGKAVYEDAEKPLARHDLCSKALSRLS